MMIKTSTHKILNASNILATIIYKGLVYDTSDKP